MSWFNNVSGYCKMEDDDPRRPLLGNRPEGRYRSLAGKLCGLESWKRRLPITIWLPKYRWEYLVKDIIAGVTVGLTSIPQGIAYAIVAGVPPQVGLYSSIFPGMVYVLFGSCKDVTVGPTAILSALLAKYVALSVDFAYLAAFLSGCFILLLGVLQLGFLLDFISKPVISGFTTAAALQIAASQLKTLFRISGSSGNTFVSALVNFFKNISTIHLWDTLLGIGTIISLIILKKTSKSACESDSACRRRSLRTWRYFVQARNALVVLACAVLAFALHKYGMMPFALTGTIQGGLPKFGLPPFSTQVNNATVNFEGMLSIFGAEGLVMPLVAILESIAIAKAFAGSSSVDATQEMIAVGMINLVSSFAQSMPATGSFTRTAINHASGVVTPLGSFVKACLVLLSVTLMTEAFFFIPRATLAGIIFVAMASLIELKIVRLLWRNSKLELLVYVVTVVTGACAGLEYGILAGASVDVMRVLAAAARPDIQTTTFKVGHQDCTVVSPAGVLPHAAAAHATRRLRAHTHAHTQVLVLDAHRLRALDVGVAEDLISVILDLEKEGHRFLVWNCSEDVGRLLEDLQPGFGTRLVSGPSIDQHILGLDVVARREIY